MPNKQRINHQRCCLKDSKQHNSNILPKGPNKNQGNIYLQEFCKCQNPLCQLKI